MNGAEQTAGPRIPRHIGDCLPGGHPFAERDDGYDHRDESAGIADQSRPRRRRKRGAQAAIEHLLRCDADTGAQREDIEEESLHVIPHSFRAGPDGRLLLKVRDNANGWPGTRGRASRLLRMGFAIKAVPSMIRKLQSGEYRLYSRKINPKTGKRRNLGTFKSRAAAEKHERAVQYFKRH